ncbi:MAG: lysophospholipid transporter LplT [Sutterella sp.]|nr:lysophospholipid transporter LplT [Sutterella sp.]MCI6632141.1 lysophospholipid transporter LplT [Sutterella sp.]
MMHRLAPVLGAQFFSSLADNALLIAAIALLTSLNAPDWMTPLLRLVFVLSYILLASWVGVLADMWPKGRVMFVTNLIKIGGCLLLLFGSHPLLAYGVVGAGAAAYSPAKYGILAEMLPPQKLVAANGWMEGLTVISIILGIVLGGILVDPAVGKTLIGFMHMTVTGQTTLADAAIVVVTLVYGVAALINLKICNTGAKYPNARFNALGNVITFAKTCKTIFTDTFCVSSLLVTTLFWGTGAVLQFLVLRWADERLGLPLSQASMLQAVVSVGIAFGAVLAARLVPIHRAFHVLWTGVAMGLSVAAMSFYSSSLVPGSVTILHETVRTSVLVACLMMIVVGTLAGLFLVPMNAVFQRRGQLLLSSGQAVAVQNLSENTMILTMLGIYALLVKVQLSVQTTMLAFGFFLTAAMTTILYHRFYLKPEESLEKAL